MGTLINFFRGSVRIEVTGAFPERFVNLCAQQRVAFWGVEWQGEGTVRLTVRGRDRRRLEALAQRVMCTVSTLSGEGLPFFLGRFRRRYALLIGLALSLSAVCVLSRFVLIVEVTGNEQVPTAQIVAELRRQGLRVGSYGPGLDTAELSHQALLQLPELSWMTINLHGTRAQVLVREGVAKPEIEDESELGDIVAEAPGIITGLEVLQGDGVVKEGDTVDAGDVLISGTRTLPVPEYSELTPEQLDVRAKGRVYARTWRTLTAQIPLQAQVKDYTGQEERRWSLLILGGRLNFYGNSGISFDQYDKISDTWTAHLPGGGALPLTLVRETARAYATQSVPIDQEAAQTMLEARLEEAVLEALGEDGELVGKDFTAAVADGVLTVTLKAECREEIGRFVPRAGQ